MESRAVSRNFFAPDGFKQFHESPDGVRYLADFNGLTTDSDHKTIRMRRIEAELPHNKHRVEYAAEYLYNISCSSGEVFLVNYAVYRSNGEELYSKPVNANQTIVPGTYLDMLVNIVCGRRPLTEEKIMTFCTSTHVPDSIYESYGDKRLYSGVEVMKTSEGLIGGFVIKPAIMDSPIRYLDCSGTFLALFHIFDAQETKEGAMKIIDPLTEAFPVRELLDFKARGDVPGPR
jgi:hypothetical protein